MLEIRDLHITITMPKGRIEPVRGLDLTVRRGEFFGIVGESGCGKSIACLSLLGLTPPNAKVIAACLTLDGNDLTRVDWRTVRGHRAAMIFQDPSATLNPVFTIGQQLDAVLKLHGLDAALQRRQRAMELLEAVKLPDPVTLLTRYPHQLSGGMQQRAMIALALATGAQLLIADEPTTALDVGVQAQILGLLGDLRDRLGLTIILVTHDLAVVAEFCDRVAVIYAGRTVEEASVQSLFRQPAHPYTRALLESLPTADHQGWLRSIDGSVPSAGAVITGCSFAPRCGKAIESCKSGTPAPIPVGPDHTACCIRLASDG